MGGVGRRGGEEGRQGERLERFCNSKRLTFYKNNGVSAWLAVNIELSNLPE